MEHLEYLDLTFIISTNNYFNTKNIPIHIIRVPISLIKVIASSNKMNPAIVERIITEAELTVAATPRLISDSDRE